MNTNPFLRSVRLARLVCTFVVGVFFVGSLSVVAEDKPNIVLYIADDHGRNDSSVYDTSSQAITPNMAKLASEGLTFNNAFVASPACGPSRSALLSGLMPIRNGGEHNHERPKPKTQIMIGRMQAAGYDPAYAAEVKRMALQLDNWMTRSNDTVRMQHEPYLLSYPYPGKRVRVVPRKN